jgi:uncharacterized membrane protein
MSIFILGLILFLGIHSIGIFAQEWRSNQIRKTGLRTWKVIYSTASIAALILMVFGYKQHTAMANIVVWSPPAWTWSFLVYSNFVPLILLVASYVPRNSIKIALEDPMAIGIIFWAATHLTNVGSLAGIILFVSFLIWGVLALIASRKRRSGTPPKQETASARMNILTIALGLGLWSQFARYAYSLKGIDWF